MLDALHALTAPMLAAASPQAASLALFDALAREGATYLQTRLYRRPVGPLTSREHFAAGGLVARVAPEGWRAGSAAFDYVCFTRNPLLKPIRQGLTRYRFGDFAPHDAVQNGAYWEALGEAGISEALCATSYGSDGRIASLHLGFGRRSFGPQEASLFHLAGLMLTERIMETGEAPPRPLPRLTVRERDALGLVAEGKTDFEIGVILGVSESTGRFHVDNARSKLGAVNRAHAVAKLLESRLI